MTNQSPSFGSRFEKTHLNTFALCSEMFTPTQRPYIVGNITHRDVVQHPLANKTYMCPLLYYLEIWYNLHDPAAAQIASDSSSENRVQCPTGSLPFLPSQVIP